jgi:hypothetical protein
MAPDDDDKRVKDLLGSTTQADLERWFSLPSFDQVADAPKPAAVVDEEMEQVRARRAAATAAVDRALLARIIYRVEEHPETLIEFRQTIDVIVKDMALFDETMVDKGFSIAEPREVEIPEALRDDLKDCTPQALLRDLHRAETDFDKTFEIVDFSAEQRLDIVAEVAEAMRTSWTLPPLAIAPWNECVKMLADARVDRYKSWSHVLHKLPNRRVEE